MKNHLSHHLNDYHLSFLNHRVIYQDHFIHHHQIRNHHSQFSGFLNLIHLNHQIESQYLILLLPIKLFGLDPHPTEFII